MLMSVEPFATSVCDNGSLKCVIPAWLPAQQRWRTALQTGPAVSVRRGGKHTSFSSKYSLHKRYRGRGNKKGHSHGPYRSLPVRHPASTPLSPRPSCRPSRLYAFLSSVPSIGQVQSESLAELRLSHLISKSRLFHLSKCLRSQLLYAKDKGCLLSTEDWLFHPPLPHPIPTPTPAPAKRWS